MPWYQLPKSGVTYFEVDDTPPDGAIEVEAPPGTTPIPSLTERVEDLEAFEASVPDTFAPHVVGVSGLRAVESPPSLMLTRGYSTAADGGGGLWWWDSSDTTSADNGGTVLAPTSAAVGRWKRVVNGPVDIRWFGAASDRADNTAEIQAAVTWACTRVAPGGSTSPGGVVLIPFGYFRCKFLDGTSGLSTITIDSDNVTIRGEGTGSILTVRAPTNKVEYFFTFAQGIRGQGGGVRDLHIEGNSELNWCVYLDTWRKASFTDITVRDVHGGILDACSTDPEGANALGENIEVRHLDYVSSSGTDACFTQYGVRFRAATGGTMWTECWISDSLFVNCWDTGVVLDGCSRLVVCRIGAGCDSASTNTIDGLEKEGIRRAVEITNTVTNTYTADTGYHVVRDIYMESHSGAETTTGNVAVVIDCPAGQTGYVRYNHVEKVAISTETGPGIFRITNTSGTFGLVTNNTFHDNRRGYRQNLITVGEQVDQTFLWVTGARGVLYGISDLGIRTYVNGVTKAAWGAAFPASTTPSSAANDVGNFSRDTDTGRLALIDRDGTPVLIGPRAGTDVVVPYGAQRISSLGTPAAPVVTKSVAGATTWTYYVVAVDKDGNKTPPSPAGTITDGPASLAGSSQNIVKWAPVVGAVTYDLLRGSTTTSVATGLATCHYADQAAGTSAYTPSATSPMGKLVVDGHVTIGSTTVPTITAGSAAGTGPTVSITGNDHDGYIQIVTGTTPGTGTLATITFSTPMPGTPKCPLIGPAMGGQTWFRAFGHPFPTASSWELRCDVALNASQTYRWAYHVAA